MGRDKKWIEKLTNNSKTFDLPCWPQNNNVRLQSAQTCWGAWTNQMVTTTCNVSQQRRSRDPTANRNRVTFVSTNGVRVTKYDITWRHWSGSHGIFRCFEYRKVESTIPKWSGPQGWGWNHGPIIGHGSFFLISQIFWRFGFPFFCLFRPLWALYVSLFSLLVGYTKDGLQQNGTLYKGYGTLPHSFNVTCDLTLGEFFQIVINQPIFKKWPKSA